MTSGPLPPNPSEVLGSARMKTLLQQLTADADLVLLDAPPVIAVTDAVLLATKVDGVLLVIRAGQTKREHAERARDLLAKVNARLVGAVLNNAALDASAYGVYGQN